MKKEDKIHKLFQPGVCQQKWLQMGFEPMPAPTRDVLWIKVIAARCWFRHVSI